MRKVLMMSVLAAVFVLGGVSESLAVRPAGWAYHNGNYLYSRNAAGWLYLNAQDEQWVINLGSSTWGVVVSYCFMAALTHEFDFPPIAGAFEDAAIIFFAK